jgi:Protein of unknown function (DUF1822)
MINMTFRSESLTFTSSLTADFKHQALAFSREQQNPQKARQVYLNTLAVQAVNFYFECIGIKTDLTASDSWNATLRTLMNVADLVVKDKGQLECLPVLPTAEICPVPPEVQEERLGYVVVTIDEAADEARLQGFSPTAAAGQLVIPQLPSLAGLINALIADSPEKVPSPLVKLGQWFQDTFDELWQAPELVLAASYRGAVLTQEPESLPFRKKAKLLEIGAHKIALVVQVTQLSATEQDILLKICPSNSNILPEGLLMQLFDESDQMVMETQTQQADNFRSLQFQIGTAESFSIKIELASLSITEKFLS